MLRCAGIHPSWSGAIHVHGLGRFSTPGPIQHAGTNPARQADERRGQYVHLVQSAHLEPLPDAAVRGDPPILLGRVSPSGFHLTQSLFKVDLQESTPPQIRQLNLYCY